MSKDVSASRHPRPSAGPPEGLTAEEFAAMTGMRPLPPIPASHKPLPMEYSAAVKAIVACRTIDETKYWDNYADALAAWAKIYADDSVLRGARALKLHAYRRIGELAEQLRPQQYRGRQGVVGPNSLLREHGFGSNQARVIRKIAQMSNEDFRSLTSSERPPSPSTVADFMLRRNPLWAVFSQRMRMFLSKSRYTGPSEVASSLSAKEVVAARVACTEMMVWLQEFAAELSRMDSCASHRDKVSESSQSARL